MNGKETWLSVGEAEEVILRIASFKLRIASFKLCVLAKGFLDYDISQTSECATSLVQLLHKIIPLHKCS